MLTLSFNPSTIVRKNAMIRLPASVASKKPARIAETVPPVTVTSSHGKRNRKARHADTPRICSRRKPSASKNSGSIGKVPRPLDRSSESPASKISSANKFASMINNVALFINDRECEKLVKDEELTRVEQRCFRRNSHDAPHHHFVQCGFQWRCQQPPGRHDAHQPVLFVDRIKVNYTL